MIGGHGQRASAYRSWDTASGQRFVDWEIWSVGRGLLIGRHGQWAEVYGSGDTASG